MAKLDKVLAVYDRNGNRQAIPLYTTLEDVNNLGRKIKLGNTEAYYPLTKDLTDSNASKKVIVIGTKTYKALLKVSTVGFKTILEALDENKYLSASKSKRLDDIDRSIGGEVKIRSTDNMNDYDFVNMYSNNTVVQLDNYDTTNKLPCMDRLDLSKFNNSDLNMTYKIPSKSIIYQNVNGSGNLKTVMNIPYTDINDAAFFGSSVYNTYSSCLFIGNYTGKSTTDIVNKMAFSYTSSDEFISGSKPIKPIVLGQKSKNINPMDQTANNSITTNKFVANDINSWQFAILVHQASYSDDCIKYLTPFSKSGSNEKNELNYLYKTTKYDVSGLTDKMFKDINIMIADMTFETLYNIKAALKYSIRIIATDTNGKAITLADFTIYSPLISTIYDNQYSMFVKNTTDRLKRFNKRTDNVLFLDYNKATAGKFPYIKVLFGAGTIHILLIKIDFNENTQDLNIVIRTLKGSNILSVDSENEYQTWIANFKTPRINTNIYRYNGRYQAFKFNIVSSSDTSRYTSTEELEAKKLETGMFIFSTNTESESSIDMNKDLFLFNIFNRINESGYDGSVNCIYHQEAFNTSEVAENYVFKKIQKITYREAMYYPLDLKTFK